MAVSYLQQHQELFNVLQGKALDAGFIGVQDFANMFLVQLRYATPKGWKYVPLQLTKKGEKLAKKGGYKGPKGNWNYKKLKAKDKTFKKSTGKWKYSGFAREQWAMQVDAAGRGLTIDNPVPYIHVLEQGLYPNPPTGPLPKGKPWEQGWRVEGGFSKQAQDGIVKPLFADDKLWERAQATVVRRINQVLNSIPNVKSRSI